MCFKILCLVFFLYKSHSKVVMNLYQEFLYLLLTSPFAMAVAFLYSILSSTFLYLATFYTGSFYFLLVVSLGHPIFCPSIHPVSPTLRVPLNIPR
jgi:hypothetical protein